MNQYTFLTDSRLKVRNPNGETKEFSNLTLYYGRAMPLPNMPLPIVQSLEFYELETYPNIDFNFFNQVGNYHLQFVLYSATGFYDKHQPIESNTLIISIANPQGLDKEAYDFLNANGKDVGFRNPEASEEKRVELLKFFVEKYGKTVYGEITTGYLGTFYKVKGDLDKSQAEFEKIKFSKNPISSKGANKSLEDIARKKEKMNQPNRPQ